MSTLIIAEAGVNHNGDTELAGRLVDAAAAAGCDIVKFQTFSADRIVTAQAKQATYQSRNSGIEETQHAMLKRLELSRPAHEALMLRARERGIEFLSTAFDLQSIELLVELALQRFKVPSGEITNLPYLRRIGRTGKPVILSTGMATMTEIGEALEVLEKAGTPRERITVLQCTTEYPAPMADVNLRAMSTIGETFGVQVGYSDHTLGIEVAIAAVARGASLIEKHFTLDRSLPGPDHRASLEPGELAAMVASIRNVEQALGDGVKRPGQGELRNVAAARKSLVAACDIRAGERFTEANLTVKRPGTGISPMQWDAVMGRTASRNFAADELIEL